MPATPTRIGFITEEVRRAIAGPLTAVSDKYGDLARDTKEPVETFFDSVDDAETMAEERLALLSADRRRLRMDIAGCETGVALTFNQVTPTARIIDDERMIDRNAAIVEIAIDFDKNLTTLTPWG